LLADSVAAQTRPDLPHVEAQVLAAFDASAEATTRRALFNNCSDGVAFNRALRKRLLEEFTCVW
jgi:hypothetical protein